MNKYLKTISITLLVALILYGALLGYGVYQNLKDTEQLLWSEEKTEFYRLALNKVRGETEPIEEIELMELIKKRDKSLYDFIKKHKERPISAGTIVVGLPSHQEDGAISNEIVSSTYSKWIKIGDDKETLSFAKVSFDLLEKEWSYYTLQNQIMFDILSTELETGEWNHYYTVHMGPDPNKSPLEDQGKKIKLEIVSAKIKMVPLNKQTDKWKFFNPTASLGAGLGFYNQDGIQAEPDLQLSSSFITYGKHRDHKLKLAEVIILGADEHLGIGISPISFRPSEMDIFSNTYLRPITASYQVDWRLNEGRLRIDTGVSLGF